MSIWSRTSVETIGFTGAGFTATILAAREIRLKRLRATWAITLQSQVCNLLRRPSPVVQPPPPLLPASCPGSCQSLMVRSHFRYPFVFLHIPGLFGRGAGAIPPEPPTRSSGPVAEAKGGRDGHHDVQSHPSSSSQSSAGSSSPDPLP